MIMAASKGSTDPIQERRNRRLQRRKELLQFVLNIVQAISVAGTLLHYARTSIEEWYLYHWVWLILCILFFLIWFSARVQLGTHLTFQAKADRILVSTGLYRYFKHPIYYFGTLALICYVILIERYIYFWGLLILIPFQLYRTVAEQRVLKKKFGEDYVDYCQRVLF